MKKLFNVVVGGYYAGSIVLGFLAYLLVSLMTHEVNAYWWNIDDVWSLRLSHFLPTEVFYNALYINDVNCAPLVSVMLAILFVTLFVVMVDGKGNGSWRTKFMHMVGFAGVFICCDLSFKYAMIRMWDCQDMHPLTILVPVVVMIVPLMVLAKTRQIDQSVQGTKRLKTKLVRKGLFTRARCKPLK